MQLVGLSSLEYDEKYYQEHKDAELDYLGHGYWQEQYAKMVSKGLPQEAIVFDAGCACGSILQGFKKLGFKVKGLDLSQYMVDLGKSHFGYADDELLCGSLTDIPLPSNSVDLVHSAQVLEHIPQEHMTQIIAELERILKPGGKAFLCLDAIRQGETKEMYMGDPTHVNIQPIEYWTKILQKHNLLFDIQGYNDFVRSEYGPTQGNSSNFFEHYPYWSVFTLIKE
jgi:2-polyprenyl-3-methyl-5-hydroxy-6-metoxy-1,4-benzoquinol methylase